MLKQFRKDPNFEKMDFDLIYTTTKDAVFLIMKSSQTPFETSENSNSNNNKLLSFYNENINYRNSRFDEGSKPQRESLDHLTNSTIESNT